MEKEEILRNICYTELVYQRINKKLKGNFSRKEIEDYIYGIVSSKDSAIAKRGKNYYVTGSKEKVQITINSSTYRVITVDRILDTNK